MFAISLLYIPSLGQGLDSSFMQTSTNPRHLSVLEKMIFKFRHCIFAFSLLSLFGKERGASFAQY